METNFRCKCGDPLLPQNTKTDPLDEVDQKFEDDFGHRPWTIYYFYCKNGHRTYIKDLFKFETPIQPYITKVGVILETIEDSDLVSDIYEDWEPTEIATIDSKTGKLLKVEQCEVSK